MKNDRKCGHIVMDGRTFELEFYKDDFGVPYVSAYEITTKIRKPHWWSHKEIPMEIKIPIDSAWTDDNRVDVGINMIKNYLKRQEDKMKEQREIESFCSVGSIKERYNNEGNETV